MVGFHIEFSHPWLLLLLIPAFALTFFLYFRLDKRYRRTRNRIISLVLHSIVCVLVVFVLAGISMPYELENSNNELILLVDVSDTQEETQESRDGFLEQVLHETSYDGLKVGVVTFGFDQVYAVPLTYEVDGIYDEYLEAGLPDTSATDIAAALRYTAGLFEHPATAKILLVSDGMETDEEALSVIRTITLSGIKVDTASFPSSVIDNGLQVTSIVLPEDNIITGEACEIGVGLYSKEAVQGAVVELYNALDLEEGTLIGSQTVDLPGGTQTLNFSVTFTEQGLHRLSARIVADSTEVNDRYQCYVYLAVHDKVLVLEQREGDSETLCAILEEKYGEEGVHKLNLFSDSASLPKTVDELRAYDQVIMNNIAEADLPDGFDALLQDYVYLYGGGLFTTGGSNGDGTAHAYDSEDLYNTKYHSMLPIQAIEYTPPVGVVIIIDISGSMDEKRRQDAMDGAIECLGALEDRDFLGVMTLEERYGTALQITSCTQENRPDIIRAINGIGYGSATNFAPAIDHAVQALRAEKRVDKRHIIIITDGLPADAQPATDRAANCPDITLSVVGIGSQSQSDTMRTLVNAWRGQLYYASGGTGISDALRNDVGAPTITEYTPKEFYPTIADPFSPIVNGLERGGVEGESEFAIPVQLGGYYGVRARGGAKVAVTGEYNVPLYAQWQYGAGKVGSFMCDVYGEWSGEFLANDNGKRLITNIVANLMPSQEIRPTSITLTLREENYHNRLSVFYDELNEGERIEGEILYQPESGKDTLTIPLNTLSEDGDSGFYLTENLNEANSFSRASFICKKSGTYTIVVRKLDAEGNVLETVRVHKAFSYSEEYDRFADADGAALLAALAERGRGQQLSSEHPEQVLEGFDTELSRVFDPTLTFMIIAMVLFLMDIAVRKFKFKWIHELVRERRIEREGK